MKTTLAAVTAITGLLVADQASAAVVKFKATLNGAQETPAITTTSAGTADLDFDDVANTITGSVDTTMANNADVDGAHIHLAECGKSGSILKGIDINKAAFNGTIAIDTSKPVTLDADGVKALNEGRLYLNVHTKTNPGGEIRGQIFKADSTDTCPKAGGGDGGSTTTPTDGGGNTTGGDGGTAAAPAKDDGGCSTTGGSSSTSSGIVLVAGLAFVIGAVSRRRKR